MGKKEGGGVWLRKGKKENPDYFFLRSPPALNAGERFVGGGGKCVFVGVVRRGGHGERILTSRTLFLKRLRRNFL